MIVFHVNAKSCSAHQIIVIVQIKSEAIADLLETILIDEATRIAGWLRHASTILHVRLVLHLGDRGGGRVLLTVVEWVVFLRDLQTEDGVADEGTDQDECTHERGHLRPLQLEMHSSSRVWQFEVKVLIDITGSMGEVVREIISVHVVIVDEAATVLTLWLQVEANIVPVGWPHFVIGVLSVTEVLWQRQGQCTCFEKCHFTLEVLILTSVVL